MFVDQFTREVHAKRRHEAAERSRVHETKRARREIRAPRWVADLILAVAAEHRVPVAAIMSRDRHVDVVLARHAAIYRVKLHRPMVSLTRLGSWFRRDHTSIGHALASYQHGHPETPVLSRHSIEKRRASTVRFQASRRQMA